MKSFKQYINEDIALDTHTSAPENYNLEKFKLSDNTKKMTAKPAKGFSLYYSTEKRKKYKGWDSINIVEDKTGLSVGYIRVIHNPKMKKDINIVMTEIHSSYTKKKLGVSLALASYKALHKAGFTIKSGDTQTQGGASIWSALRKDKSLSKDLVLREPGENNIWGERPAAGLKDKDIYLAYEKGKKKDKIRGAIDVSDRRGATPKDIEKAKDMESSILVLHAKKSKNRLGSIEKRRKFGSTWITKNGKIGAKDMDGDLNYFELNQRKAAQDFARSIY